MKRSTERILTTHTGSLPRPPDLTQMMYDYEDGKPIDQASLRDRFRSATTEIVRQQLAAGVDTINDGEFTKVGYSTYVTDRLTGFEGPPGELVVAESRRYPEYWARMLQDRAMEGFPHLKTPSCNGPIGVKDPRAVQRDIDNFKAALQGSSPTDTFMTAASPGVIAAFLENHYYPTEEAYLAALADAMRPEYEAIAQAGFTLQLDCPDLAMTRQMGRFADAGLEDFRRSAALRVEALDHAVASIPAEQLRMHICWGNWEGPHDGDVPLRDVVDIILQAKPSAISVEGANPRHAHEWQVFEEVKLPEGKLLIPGVIESSTNYVEHPELVAQRLLNYARLVGRENVMAGSDCGFGTFVGVYGVEPTVLWRKFESMAEGARLASRRLWR